MRAIIALLLAVVAYGMPADFDPLMNEGFFDGDIAGIDPNQDRNAIPKDSQRWTGGVVPYEIEPSLNDTVELISNSMKHIEENSCIRFVKRTTERNYLSFFKGDGCWSHWGMLGNGEQKLSLGKGCYFLGTAIHELLHALGFEHEHNRSDRDDYVTIKFENINPKWHYAFEKLRPEENRLLTTFDYDSIMIYGEEAFTKQKGLKTIVPKNGQFLPSQFLKTSMSTSDTKRLNMLYKCPEKKNFI